MKKNIFLVLVSLFSIEAFSQENIYKPDAIALTDLLAFKNPTKNWQIVGSVSGNLTDAGFKSKAGTGVLMNKPDEKSKANGDLFSNFEHGDVYLELDFMIPKGSNSGIYLQSRYELQLFDSWGIKNPKEHDCGAIYQRWNNALPEGKKGFEGHPPRLNACSAPGLWQHLEITFQAPKFDATGRKISNAKFVKVVLNGMTIHENVILNAPTRGSVAENETALAPIRIQGDHGSVAFRNIKYALLNDFSLDFKDLTFQYFDISKGFDKVSKTPTRTGKADKIDYRFADNPEKFSLNFEGKINIPKTDDYQVSLFINGSGNVIIDGKDIIDAGWKLLPDFGTAKVPLTAGEHTIKVMYRKDFTWRPSTLGFTIQRPNSRPAILHESASVPDLPIDPLITVAAISQPEIQRSYWQTPTKKMTHVLSVGFPAGVHLAYNLNQGGLFNAWKGEFLRTTDMWYERGEPQVAQPLGSPILLSGKCGLAPVGVLPDSLEDRKMLIYKGYGFDEARNPVFNYEINGQKFTDKITPNGQANGLQRTLTLDGSPKNMQFRLADGDIEEIASGLYAVNKKYYVLVAKELKPTIVSAGNQKALVVVANGKKAISSLTYEIVW